MKRKLLLFGILSLLCANSYAQSRNSYDATLFKAADQQASIEVGKGFNITDPFQATRPCFTSASRDASLLKKQGTKGAETHIKVFYTENEYEYNMFKSSNKSGNISFLNMVNLSPTEIDKLTTTHNKHSEKLIFIGTVDFGNYYYPEDPVFTPEAQKLLDEGKYDAFKMRYGTHFVSGIGKASSVIVELSFESEESDEQSDYENGLSGEIHYKADVNFEVTNNTSTNNNIKDKKFVATIDIQGPHLDTDSWKSSIENLKGSDDLIGAVSGFINSQLKSMQNEEDALPVRYFFTDFTLYGCEGIKWDIAKEKKLSNINKNFLDCITIINLAQENLENNPIDNPKSIYHTLVVNSRVLGNATYTYNGLAQRATTLNPKWKSLIESAKGLVEKLQNQYQQCSDITCDIKGSCCGNTDYTEQVKALFKEYNDIDLELSGFVYDWYDDITQQDNQRVKKAKFTVINKSSNPYNIYINGNFKKELPGGYQTTWTVNLGKYEIKAVQKSGYMFDATVNYRTVNLTQEGQEVPVTIGYED